MDKENSLSFCDTVFPAFNTLMWEAELGKRTGINRIFVGSYFCECYFLRYEKFSFDELGKWAALKSLKVSFVIPIVREPDLEKAKDVVRRALACGFIDEVIVNDVGMLDYVSREYDVKIFLGRLFFKNTRDSRGPFPRTGDGINFYSSVYNQLLKDYAFAGIEADAAALDMDFEGMPEDMVLGLHEDLTYLTTGRMCAFAAAGLTDDRKFLPDEPCKLECVGNAVTYSLEGGIIIKAGKTCYCAARPATVHGVTRLRSITTVIGWGCDYEG